MESCKNSCDGSMTDQEFKNQLDNYKTEINGMSETDHPIGKLYIESVVEIGINSHNWWSANIPTIAMANSNGNAGGGSGDYGIVPWVAADIIGGAVGGFIAIVHSGADSGFTEPVDAGAVAWGILGGAVLGSTGIVGRLGKLFAW
ncbi:MAG: hypothetical protein JKX95_00030 [Bacteroidia bacterium]|nr:hypothetical protein [Bacteroidia bacterium]